MTKKTVLALCSLLALSAGSSPCRGEEYFLYAPKPAAGEQPPASPGEGVLVKQVTVKRGDTLAKLSKKHIGVAGWFPQVLLFNTIKNPDLIYEGDKLLIPVRKGEGGASEERKIEKRKAAVRRQAPSRTGRHVTEKRSAAARTAKTTETESFARARHAYDKHDYAKAATRFSHFLQKYPHSKFAADASLYRADCFLRMSGE